MSVKANIFKLALFLKITVAIFLLVQTRITKSHDDKKLITQSISDDYYNKETIKANDNEIAANHLSNVYI